MWSHNECWHNEAITDWWHLESSPSPLYRELHSIIIGIDRHWDVDVPRCWSFPDWAGVGGSPSSWLQSPGCISGRSPSQGLAVSELKEESENAWEFAVDYEITRFKLIPRDKLA